MKTIAWQDGTCIKRDMTAEEIAELERLQEVPMPPTAEERLEALEGAVLEMMGVHTDD